MTSARTAKKDEFYTQYEDIEKEMNAYISYNENVFRDKTILLPCDDPDRSNFTKYFSLNFGKLGLAKLVSTSYNKDGRGKMFVLDREGSYRKELEGNGDFRSDEVSCILERSDIVVTNPPFSLFREFLGWLMDAETKFIIIGNINSVTCKEVFPPIYERRIWLGATIHAGDRKFHVPDDYPLEASGCGVDPDGRKFVRVKGVRWYTNIEYGERHEFQKLKTMQENLASNKKLVNVLRKKYGMETYPRYDNFDALEVPVSDAIPSDYDGIMGVPITFLDKYCPEQFEIVGNEKMLGIEEGRGYINGKILYARIFIRKKPVRYN